MNLKRLWWSLFLSGLMSLSLLPLMLAGSPEHALAQDISGQIGIASDPLSCLTVGDDTVDQNAATVILNWQGQVERARLIVNIAGTEAAHTIKVNGQPATQTPIYPEGQACGEGKTFYLDISPDLVILGENLIEITNDALASDGWSAADVRLEVLGSLTSSKASEANQLGAQDVSASATESTFDFVNDYDGTIQEAEKQIPTGYTGASPVPLLVVIHPRSGSMDFGVDTFGPEANSRGWLLVSPQLHGSWPETATPQPPPAKPGAYAYASLESQYDTIGAIQHMVDNYNVDPDRIYLYGQSMGGQGGAVTVAKWPHLFAAFFDNKGPSDWVQWHQETVDLVNQGYSQNFHRKWMERECYEEIGSTPTPRAPAQNPFCYQRRSGINYASNFIHVPIKITHGISDVLVPVSHSIRLRDAVNSYNPDDDVVLTIDDQDCGDQVYFHCYVPDPADVLDFFVPHTLDNNPTSIKIKTDQSKSFYWLNVAQTGGDHWTEIEVSYDLASKNVTAVISDTNPLSLGFNLGSTPINDVIDQPGMGLPENISYLVKEQGQPDKQQAYGNGYFTVDTVNTGQYTLTISLIPGSPGPPAPSYETYLPIVLK